MCSVMNNEDIPESHKTLELCSIYQNLPVMEAMAYFVEPASRGVTFY